ncbi:TetR/AcrR family transcriptional regulator [Sphaerisporangium corydalis]|uniref:TetR/AcrR family transcriptional regulator n=1 Tax=Sphaerisporangium corydalis TaxID=1441875 RepID=A0ABV9EVS1_9ACTN|nr:TetR/AcrR family transcriptional regulator C-terminal domain-containing protein [Sphaerisporangium corydalis]
MPMPSVEQLVWHFPEPPGRKHALTRAKVVHTGIAVADAEGVAGLTMRAVADALGVSTPMSLYRYVLNKDGLIDLMLDEVSAEVDLPAEPSDDWHADLRGVASSLWWMIGRHRWYAELVDSRPPFGPHTLRRAAFMLAALDKAGFTPALTYVSLLDNYVTGTAMSVSREIAMLERFGIGATQELQAYAGEMADDSLESWLEDMPAITADERFDLGLDCLLDGIAARRPASR